MLLGGRPRSRAPPAHTRVKSGDAESPNHEMCTATALSSNFSGFHPSEGRAVQMFNCPALDGVTSSSVLAGRLLRRGGPLCRVAAGPAAGRGRVPQGCAQGSRRRCTRGSVPHRRGVHLAPRARSVAPPRPVRRRRHLLLRRRSRHRRHRRRRRSCRPHRSDRRRHRRRSRPATSRRRIRRCRRRSSCPCPRAWRPRRPRWRETPGIRSP